MGNLYDAQTPYRNTQKALEAFPSGGLVTSQFYGHGLQSPKNFTAVIEQCEDETERGVPLTYTDDVAKLLCVKVMLEYLKTGVLPQNHICKAPGPKQTWPTPSVTDIEPTRVGFII